MLSILSACETSSPEALPRIDEMASELRPAGPPEDVLQQSSAPLALATLHRLDIPLRHPTDPIWAVVDEQAIPTLTRAVWNRNGLRVGVMSRAQWNAFLDAMPSAFGTQRSALAPAALPAAVRTSPRLRSSVYVDLTIPPRAVRDDMAQGGRMKLLARLDAAGVGSGTGVAGGRYIELTPHHYLPGNNLPHVIKQGASFKVIPRTLAEKELDGRTYDDLTLRVEMPPGRLLVVGLYWPWSDPAVVNYAQRSSDAETSPDDPAGDEESAVTVQPTVESVDDLPNYAPPPPIAFHLGRSLFTGAQMGQAVQMFLVIEVD